MLRPSDPELTYELQLKGVRRMPFSQRADGLAVVQLHPWQ
jgi:uncharacterized protein YdiU (UPF0061 family)